MVTAVFIVTAIVTALGALVGLRIAMNPPPGRPAWLGLLTFVLSAALCAYAVVLAFTVEG